jgi:hypothetical protein
MSSGSAKKHKEEQRITLLSMVLAMMSRGGITKPSWSLTFLIRTSSIFMNWGSVSVRSRSDNFFLGITPPGLELPTIWRLVLMFLGFFTLMVMMMVMMMPLRLLPLIRILPSTIHPEKTLKHATTTQRLQLLR